MTELRPQSYVPAARFEIFAHALTAMVRRYGVGEAVLDLHDRPRPNELDLHAAELLDDLESQLDG